MRSSAVKARGSLTGGTVRQGLGQVPSQIGN